jgi:hypothetical protein
VLSMGASLEGWTAVETTNTMIARGSATAPVRVVNVSAPVGASITCPPFRVSAPKPHVHRWGGTAPSTTSIMPLDQVWCELTRTPSRRTSQNAPQTNFRLCEVGLLDHRPRSARHGSESWATGCFGTHASDVVNPSKGRRTNGSAVGTHKLTNHARGSRVSASVNDPCLASRLAGNISRIVDQTWWEGLTSTRGPSDLLQIKVGNNCRRGG